MSGALVHNLLLFGRLLRGLGLDISPGRMRDLAAALAHVELGRRSDVYFAARSLLVHRREDIALFDVAFDAFWRKPREGSFALDLRALGERRRFRRPGFLTASAAAADAPGAGPHPEEGPPLRLAILTYSDQDALRHRDFAQLTGAEFEAVRSMIRRLAFRPGERLTRRLRPGRGPRLDLRRTLRHSLAHGGELLAWATQQRQRKPRPLVILADVSGSMERYTRLLLLFAYSVAEGLEQRVEAFVFGTRLTRITRDLRGHDADRALGDVARRVPDWSGGTRIGEALREFNFRWGRRVLGCGAVVLLISDGWDRGEPALLLEEMGRLQRTCHRLIWLNPLLGAPDYEPLARGMRTALPYVDDFLPVHSLASLDDLGRRLSALGQERRGRAQRPRPSPHRPSSA
ncbi:MAG TPA: VWA domain-containing protein [Vicinamibacteria bacterium]|nr:VWA domain-containing protein [Vicinamibacteria bacterium]